MSSADQLAELFKRLNRRAIDGYVRSGREESLELDFKIAASDDCSSQDDKRNLAVALSGFANSVGGLIVWGVDCRRNPQGIDCAVDLKPIKNVRAFVSRVRELSLDGVSPHVADASHRAIANRNGDGFAVTLVPASEVAPHRAGFGEWRYYKRSGTRFTVMEHYEVADVFNRKQKASLVLTYSVENRGRGPEVVVGLRNEGRASARAPYLSLHLSKGRPLHRDSFGLNGNGVEGMTRLLVPLDGYEVSYMEGLNFVIHPRVSIDVVKYSLPYNVNANSIPDDVEIRFAYCAEGMDLREGSFTIPRAQILGV